MEQFDLYQDISARTGGDIYIGVVGPVRTGKSTFIKRFMETAVIPNIDNVYKRERARDELPQSGSGRTVMTVEPKFVPEEAVAVSAAGSSARVRLIDSVGYLIDGAMGQMEDGSPRMVTTPWFDHEITMNEAAELGTKKVIAEHSTVGIVVTTDGTVTDLPRESYLEAESRAVTELKALGKPFVVVINTAEPDSSAAQGMKSQLERQYGITCIAKNCIQLSQQDITDIFDALLMEFPMTELDVFLPDWVESLADDHPLKTDAWQALMESAKAVIKLKDADKTAVSAAAVENVSRAEVSHRDLAKGVAVLSLDYPRELFYQILSEKTGMEVAGDGDLMELLEKMGSIEKEYSRVQGALEQVKAVGYGIVMPDTQEMTLQTPEIIKSGGSYGVKLKASAPSIHMIRADIETEISPMVGSEQQSEELIKYLLSEYEGDTEKLWDSNIFGKSLYELINEGLTTKLKKMPDEARMKLKDTLGRIINEGSGGLICIIL